MIDFHAHIGNFFRDQYPEHIPFTVQHLVDRMNRYGIDLSVVMPLESPEGGGGYALTEEVVAARNVYPERVIAFLCVDPRHPRVPQFIDHFVTRHGCKGVGEMLNGLAVDDPLNQVIYAKCDEHRLPVDIEINANYCWDAVGLPGLERCLQRYPNAVFVGHGPAFWSAISADDPRAGYPESPIKPGGALDRLLAEHDNLYADLSAGSGFNAMTRDPEFTQGFIARHWRKLLFGIDSIRVGESMRHVEWLAGLDVAEEVRGAIADGNAMRILGLGAD